nr:hypothetical protein BaRGS_017373 [Batillaria attramentaria]
MREAQILVTMSTSRLHLSLVLVLVSSARFLNSHQLLAKDTVWLDEPCSDDGDCIADLSECFEGRCVCQPGFYYSRTKNICLEMCSYTDLQPTFVKYPRRIISSYYIEAFDTTLQECLRSCAANPRCRTVEHQNTGRCEIQAVTKLDAKDSAWEVADTYNFYQKTCL